MILDTVKYLLVRSNMALPKLLHSELKQGNGGGSEFHTHHMRASDMWNETFVLKKRVFME